MHSPCIGEASQACFHGCCPNPLLGLPDPHHNPSPKSSTSSLAASRYEFVVTTASLFPNTQFTNHESLPSLSESFTSFTEAYPQYSKTNQADQIRAREYSHLSLSNHVCLDYIGLDLFSHTQQSPPPPPPSSPPHSHHSVFPFFDISYKSANLNSHILYGGQESELESTIRKRIMGFLNISEDDYRMVFTANRSSAFKLLAESYPFQSNQRLLTVYDYESEAVAAMTDSAQKKGARVMEAEFSWQSLRIQSAKLRKMIISSKRKKSKRGLFVFPLQSKVTGARYSYLWMSIAQENGWHILLDACALGPKDMDTLGLSLFQPDFLICSFYRVFGENPSGFGCLFVKRSSASVLETSTVARSIGIVSLVPTKKISQLPDDSFSSDIETQQEQTSKYGLQEEDDLVGSNSFSGPISVQMSNEMGKQSSSSTRFEHGETSEIRETESKKNLDPSEVPSSSTRFEHGETSEIREIESKKNLDPNEIPSSSTQVTESEKYEDGQTSEERKTEVDVKQKGSVPSEIVEEIQTHDVKPKKIETDTGGDLEIECRGLDHADSLGLILMSSRARYLINWLVNALMKLHHPHSEKGIPLVKIYGPKVKFDRGPALAFNVFDWKGEKVEPILVQKLADRSNISLSCGFLHHIWFSDKYEEERDKVLETRGREAAVGSAGGSKKKNKAGHGITVVTAALGFLASFEDVYRLWAFVAQFLDADFVEKERWRYTALNQETIEV